MILLKLAIISVALLYSTVALADNNKISNDKIISILKCEGIKAVRCLEVQEYGHEFVGPKVDSDLNEYSFVKIKSPTIRELVCCEKDTKLQEMVVEHIFSEMRPDEVITSLVGHKIVKHTSGHGCRNISSVESVSNDDRFVGPLVPDISIKNE